MEPLNDEQRSIVEANTGLVNHFLRLHRCPTWRWDDAYQDGLLGLMLAAQRFDPGRGFQFSTYAHHWIRQQVRRGRGRFEGKSFRSSERGYASEFEWPVSLDAALGAVLLANEHVDDYALIQAALAEVHALCRDDLDHAVADAIEAMITDGQTTIHTDPIALRFGVCRATVRNRRARLMPLLRRGIEVAA